jgi:hypothetical protein
MIVSIKRYFSAWGQTSNRLAFAIISSGLMLAAPAFAADITVASPVNGTTIAAPIWVRAHNVGCDGLTPTAFGYSVDNSSTLVRGVTKYDVDATKVSIGAGTHTIHFKSWTTKGICPVVSTTFKVGSGGSSSGNTSGDTAGSAPSGSIPANAVGSADLDGKSWPGEKDAGTPGSARGSTVYPASTPSYDDAREFYMTYSKRGGVRWHNSFAKDAGVTHFVYDTYVYITDPSQVGNIELDMNQVMSNGKTVVYGTQCSTYTKTWEYTINSGGNFRWKSSNIGCNPRSWAAKTWHHVQIASHRDGSGDVTYDWVNLDGAHHVFSNAKGNSARSLGWAKGDLLINFQLDGYNTGSGSITSYIHKMTIFRW